MEVLSFSDLEPYLLLKNGNILYKVPFRGGWAVIKVYYGSRSFWQSLSKSVNNVVLLGQTSYWPSTRLRVELDCLRLWRRHGFRVFDWYEDVEVQAPGCPPGGYLVFGFCSAPILEDLLLDEGRPIEERMALYRGFLAEWSRRHDVAEAERDPRLVHENGDFGHIMVPEDGQFLWFDLEMVYRSRSRIGEYLGHEIIQYLWYILRKVPPTLGARLFEETVAHYPNQERLARAPDVFLHHPRLLMRLGRKLDGVRAKAQKPTSKYNVARRLREAMSARGESSKTR